MHNQNTTISIISQSKYFIYSNASQFKLLANQIWIGKTSTNQILSMLSIFLDFFSLYILSIILPSFSYASSYSVFNILFSTLPHIFSYSFLFSLNRSLSLLFFNQYLFYCVESISFFLFPMFGCFIRNNY